MGMEAAERVSLATARSSASSSGTGEHVHEWVPSTHAAHLEQQVADVDASTEAMHVRAEVCAASSVGVVGAHVVLLLLLGVGQHGVGFVDFFELELCLGLVFLALVRMSVWVELEGLLLEGFLYVVLGGLSFDSAVSGGYPKTL